MVGFRAQKAQAKVRQPKRFYDEAVLQKPANQKQEGRKEE